MYVGTLKFEIFIPGCTSLKDKRKVIQSIQNKIKSKFNVSIAEIDFQDKWQRTVIGVCFVNSEKSEIERIIQLIKDIFHQNGDFLVIKEDNRIIYISES